MRTKKIIILTLLIVYVLPAFAQTAEGQEEIQIDKVQKVPKHTYSWQPFVVGGAAFGVPTALFRLQAGMVKKWGFYVAGTTNFHFNKPDIDYGENETGYSFTNKKIYNRWVVNAGAVLRINPKFMTYLGIGFGHCDIIRETVDGQLMYSHHYPIFEWSLMECDMGVIYNIKRFVVSAGFSYGFGGNIHYTTGNIGVGIIL